MLVAHVAFIEAVADGGHGFRSLNGWYTPEE